MDWKRTDQRYRERASQEARRSLRLASCDVPSGHETLDLVNIAGMVVNVERLYSSDRPMVQHMVCWKYFLIISVSSGSVGVNMGL